MDGTPHPPSDLTDALLAEASWVRALALRLARDQAAADDVTQEVLALALERRPAVRASLRPWLARVAARLARRAERSELRRSDHERASAMQRADDVEDERLLERLELQERLVRRVRALPEPYRGLVLRRFYEGRSTAEIARQTGASDATVRSQLARGLERLRRDFERERRELDGDSIHGTALALLLAAGTNAPNLLSGSLLVKTSTKLTAALCLAGLLGVGAVTWLTRADSPAPEALDAARNEALARPEAPPAADVERAGEPASPALAAAAPDARREVPAEQAPA
ncbi:MAG: sigma-70 family RNA polymerase sigma factor, partial [Planctomycetota bacterium]